MATFDLRKELMEINDKFANLNALRNEENFKQLEVNYKILHASLKSLMATVKKVFPEYENELLAENIEMIQLLSKGIVAHCSDVYKKKEEEKSMDELRYQELNADNATDI